MQCEIYEKLPMRDDERHWTMLIVIDLYSVVESLISGEGAFEGAVTGKDSDDQMLS
jgi:hypothetical protein